MSLRIQSVQSVLEIESRELRVFTHRRTESVCASTCLSLDPGACRYGETKKHVSECGLFCWEGLTHPLPSFSACEEFSKIRSAFPADGNLTWIE